MPRAPGGCQSGRVLVNTSFLDINRRQQDVRLGAHGQEAQTYRADVQHRRQVQDILDRGLGGIQRGGLEERVVLGHGACEGLRCPEE